MPRTMTPGNWKGLVLAALTALSVCVLTPSLAIAGATSPVSEVSVGVVQDGDAHADVTVNGLRFESPPGTRQFYVSIDDTNGNQLFYSPQGFPSPNATCTNTPDINHMVCPPNYYGIIFGNLGPGNDLFQAATNVRILIGAETTEGKRFLKGGDRKDVIRGGAAADWIKGSAGKDKLYGRKGKDHLDGGTGIDFCKGGGGTDLFRNCETGSQ
jgi:Ca2+-binding RTX toxin-like protein